jgi:hypothetical protein
MLTAWKSTKLLISLFIRQKQLFQRF